MQTTSVSTFASFIILFLLFLSPCPLVANLRPQSSFQPLPVAVLGASLHTSAHQYPEQKERIFFLWKAIGTMIPSYTNSSSKVFVFSLVLVKLLTNSKPSLIKGSGIPVLLCHLTKHIFSPRPHSSHTAKKHLHFRIW